MSLDVESALEEVSSKTDKDIEEETAWKWASRAVACYKNFVATNDKKWLLRVDSYSQEALEHAALVRDGGATVGQVEKAMTDAIASLVENLPTMVNGR
jgi:hypothetical protein